MSGNANHLGSAMLLTTYRIAGFSDGGVAEYYRYGPYGAPAAYSVSGATITPGAERTDRLFTGQRWDPTAKVYDFHARFYDPRIARFLTPDAVLQGTNPYAYVSWNPVNRLDPDGRTDYPLYTFEVSYLPSLSFVFTDYAFDFGPVGDYTGLSPFYDTTDAGFAAARAFGESVGDAASAEADQLSEFDPRAGYLKLGGFVARNLVPPDTETFLVQALEAELGGVAFRSLGLALRGAGGAAGAVAPRAANARLERALRQLFRESDKIEGGTAGAIRYQLRTGKLVGGKSHILKGQERASQLERILKQSSSIWLIDQPPSACSGTCEMPCGANNAHGPRPAYAPPV